MSLTIDATGILAANLVANESQTTSSIYANALKDIYPAAGPYYSTGLIVTYTDIGSVTSTLVLGTDYSLIYPLPNLIGSAGSPVYGAIRLLNHALNGTIKLTYQALGGSWLYNAADIVSYQSNNYLNAGTQQVVLAPDPAVYAATNATILDSFANINAFQTLYAPVKLGVQYTALVGANGSGAPLPTNAAQETGGNLALIAANTTAGNSTLASILSAVQAQTDLASTVWFDPTVVPPTYYMRRETIVEATGAVTVSWQTPAGVNTTPTNIGNLQSVSNAENIQQSTTTFTATAAGTGFAINDTLVHAFGIDITATTPTVVYSFWMNLGPSVASGTVLTVTPSGGSLTAITTPITATSLPLPTGAATDAHLVNVQSAVGTSQTTAITVQGNAGGVAIPVSGNVAPTVGGNAISAVNPMPMYDAYQAASSTVWNSTTVVNTAQTVNTAGYDTVIVTLTGNAQLTGGVITFEVYDGAAWLAIKSPTIIDYTTVSQANLSANYNKGFQVPIGGFPQFRCRLSTILSGTTGYQVIVALIVSSAPDVSLVTVGMDPSQPLPAGANLLGKVGIDQTTPGTTNAVQVTTASPGGAIANAAFAKVTDGTNVAGITPASTAALATQPAAVVALHPTSPLPAGSNAIGTVTAQDIGLASIVDAYTTPGFVYFCEAAAGQLVTAASWRVSMLNVATGQITWAGGASTFTNIANNRSGLSYS